MKKDTHKTKVVFLVHKIPGQYRNQRCTWESDIFAYFPEDEADHKGNKTAYAHVGQHSACNPEYAKESRPATEQEYADLKSELESIGYNLEVTTL